MQLNPILRPADCRDCQLRDGCKGVVQSVIPTDATIVFIGEAPGREEDQQGKPFLGPAGKLLEGVFKSIGIDRRKVGICNVVGCRPPENRKPTTKEANTCWKYLDAELKQLQNVRVIVPLGDTALKKILPGMGTITKVHGQLYTNTDYSCKVIPAFHPAYVLRNEVELRQKFITDIRKAYDLSQGAEVQQAAPTDYHVIETKEQFDWLIDELNNNEEWACDLETTGYDFAKDRAFIVGFCWQEYTGVICDLRKPFFVDSREYVFEKFKEVFANNSRKIFHNGSFDIEFLMFDGIYVNNYYVDTIHCHHLLNENNHHGLEILAQEYTDKAGYELPLLQYVKQHNIDSYSDIPEEIIYPYACGDVDTTLRSWHKMWPMIQEQELEFVLFGIVMPAQIMLIMTEFEGVQVDVEYLDQTIVKYTQAIKEQKKIIQESEEVKKYEDRKRAKIREELLQKYKASSVAKKRFRSFQDYYASRKEKEGEFVFNPNSHLQLKELLIDQMGLPVIKYTRKGRVETTNPSLDAEVLAIYATKYKQEFCAALSKASSLAHLKGTFLDGIKERLDKEGRAHTDYLLFGTKTGRPSSRNPNLNNIPSNMTAKDIKDIFCADKDQWLLEVDGKQMEFRTWINYSADPQALYDLKMGIDIHKLGAAACKGIAIPKGNLTKKQYAEIVKTVTKEERRDAKFTIFGCIPDSQYILTQRGVKTVKEVIGKSFKIFNGQKFTSARCFATKKASTLVINDSLEVSKEHILIALTKDGIVEKEAKELKIGDYLFMPTPPYSCLKRPGLQTRLNQRKQQKYVKHFYRDGSKYLYSFLSKKYNVPLYKFADPKLRFKELPLTPLEKILLMNTCPTIPVKSIRKNPTVQQLYDIATTIDPHTFVCNGYLIHNSMYGRGAKSVAEQYGITVQQAQAVQDWFFGRYPKAKIWLQRQVTHARMHGYVVNMFGRRRRLPDITSKDIVKKGEAERQSQNSPIQGAASDLTLLAGIRIMNWIWATGRKTKLVLTVYDSLVFTVPDEELEDVAKFIYHELQQPPEGFNVVVNLEAEMKIGTHWGSLVEVDPEKEDWKDVYNNLVRHQKELKKERL